jgi:hypothetical protein
VVEGDGVFALVTGLPDEELRVSRRDLQRHLGVIEEAFDATTILPCRFGSVVGDVGDLLAARRDELMHALRALEGRAQLNVKATYEEDVLLAGIVGHDAEIARLREATRSLGEAGYAERFHLGELVATAVADQRERDADRILAALSREAEDVVVDEPPEDVALKASFLVERGRLARFDSALEQLADANRPLLRFDVIGPLPPTAFASTEA